MSRRAFLASLAGSAGLSTLSNRFPSSLDAASSDAASTALRGTPALLPSWARRPTYRTDKQSTADPTGGNRDWVPIAPGATQEIFHATGAGVITHLWITIEPEDSAAQLKELVLRAYWDGSPQPSIETPLGDFFGLNVGEYVYFNSAFIACAPGRSLSSYFTMPYRHGARMTITNEGAAPIRHFFVSVEYQQVDALPEDALYFHAQYRQATPTVAHQLPNEENRDGAFNYVFCETHGCGALLGVTLGVVQVGEGWMGEGDDMTFIDDPTKPKLIGTGLEDYFNASWGFLKAFAYPYYGVTMCTPGWPPNSRSCAYRFHADNPIAFERYLKHTIEHGTGNNRGDHFYSCCYWYQETPAKDFPRFPSLAERMVGLPPMSGRSPDVVL